MKKSLLTMIVSQVAIFSLVLLAVHSVVAMSFIRPSLTSPEGEDVELVEIMRQIEKNLLEQPSPIESVKRTLDLGFSRGFSGSQAAKHLMGLAAAKYAGGPGRRRRSVNLDPLVQRRDA